MADKKCQFCGKQRDLFKIELTNQMEEFDLSEPPINYVCGQCWDTIAEIASLICKAILAKPGKEKADG